MSVSTTVRKNVYNGNGVTKEFSFSFKVLNTSQVKLLKTDVNGVTTPISDNATVTIVSEEAGTVLYPNNDDDNLIIQDGEKLTIYREVEKTQEFIDISIESAFNSENVENAIDTLVMRDQELQEEVDRCLKVGIETEKSFDEYIDTIMDITSNINNIEDNIEEIENKIDTLFLVQSVTASTASTVIDLSLGNIIILTLEASTTLSFINITYPLIIRLNVIQGTDGNKLLTFPSSFLWSSIVPVILSTDEGSIDVFQLFTDINTTIKIDPIGFNYKELP